MLTTRAKPLTLLVAMTFTIATLGCAHRKPTQIVVPEPKPDAGTVGISMAPPPYKGHFQPPATIGAGSGAKQGAKTGAVAPIAPGLFVTALGASAGEANTTILGIMLVGAGVALAPAGAAIGAAIGAIAAPSKNDVERSAAALEQALADADLAGAIPAWIIASASDRPIVLIGQPDGPRIDTRLEIDPPKVSLESADAKAWTPALTLRVALEARLVRSEDGEPLRVFSWRHEGARATFLEWGKADARIFRDELQRAGRALASKVVADLY